MSGNGVKLGNVGVCFWNPDFYSRVSVLLTLIMYRGYWKPGQEWPIDLSL